MSPFPSWLARLATLVGTATLATATACSHKSSGQLTTTPIVVADAAPAAVVDVDGGAPGGFVKANIDYVLNPQNLPAYTGPTGSVEGTVTIDGPPAPSVPVDASKCAAALDT